MSVTYLYKGQTKCSGCHRKGGCQGCRESVDIKPVSNPGQSNAVIMTAWGTWEDRQNGARPIVAENTPVSRLTPKYQEHEHSASVQHILEGDQAYLHDSVSMRIHENRSIFRLPGQGEQTNDKCGQWTHPLSCPNHGQQTLDGRHHDRYVVMHSCHKPDCPVCYESWASRQATNSADRLNKANALYLHAGYKLGRFKHVVFSPPQELAKELIRTAGGSRKLRADAVKIAKKAGIVAAAMIFHPFRQNDPRESNYREDLEPWVWYESPHFHFVGVGYLKKSDEFYKTTGWVYNNIGRRETLKGTIKYTLTHCGIADGFQALTYVGLFSNNKVVIDYVERITEPIKCQACGEALHLYSMKETEEGLKADWGDDLGVYLHIVVKKHYKLGVKPAWISSRPDIESYRKRIAEYDKRV